MLMLQVPSLPLALHCVMVTMLAVELLIKVSCAGTKASRLKLTQEMNPEYNQA